MLLGGGSRAEARSRREELLERMGIARRADAAPAQMSGGEQQRVAIARALANRPSVVLADEPTGNLDSTSAREVLDLLRESRADGQALLLVTHDPRVAATADRVITMRDGLVVDEVACPTPGPCPTCCRSGACDVPARAANRDSPAGGTRWLAGAPHVRARRTWAPER